jgi:hypothetical protein
MFHIEPPVQSSFKEKALYAPVSLQARKLSPYRHLERIKPTNTHKSV